MEGQNNMVIILLNDKSVKYSGMYRTLSEPYQEYETWLINIAELDLWWQRTVN